MMNAINVPDQEQPLYQTNYIGFWIKVYPTRVDFKFRLGGEFQSVPINQIASVKLGMAGLLKITLETTGGKKYKIPTKNKKQVLAAIHHAQTQAQSPVAAAPSEATVAGQIEKLYGLKQKGVISQEEFEAQKNKLLAE